MKEEMLESTGAKVTGPERIIEILVVLLGEMQGKKDINDLDLGSLAALGFTESEISTAFSWLYDKLAVAETTGTPLYNAMAKSAGWESPSEQSFRVYHDFERKVLSPSAQGYLLQLRALGLMSDSELENLIDRIMQLGFMRIDVKDLKELVSGVIFDFDDSTRTGSRMMLSVNDTIH